MQWWLHFWAYFMHAQGMQKCVLVFACMLHVYCMILATFLACVLYCSVPFVCIMACSSVWIVWHALVRTCFLVLHTSCMHKACKKCSYVCLRFACMLLCMRWLCLFEHTLCGHKACKMHANCLLYCSAPFVCIFACSSVWILLHALVRTCCLSLDIVCMGILHAFVPHICSYFRHAQGMQNVFLLLLAFCLHVVWHSLA